MKIIYILGHGRSGSTYLDLLLSSRARGFSLGQFIEYRDLVFSGASCRCTCGRDSDSCEVWAGVIEDDRTKLWVEESQEADPLFDRSRTREALRLISARYRRRTGDSALDGHNDTLRRLVSLNGSTLLVDSSKNTTRHRALSQLPDVDLVTVFLYRDVLGVVDSKSSAKSERIAGRTTAALSWALQNLVSATYVRKISGEVHVLSHAELFNDPEGVARNILGEDFDRSRSLSERREQHMLFGNSVRQDGSLKVRPGLPRQQSGLAEHLLVRFVGAPVQRMIRGI